VEFYDVIRQKRRIRAYGPAPIPPERSGGIFEAAQLAPTACNREPFRFVLPVCAEARQMACEGSRGGV